MIGHYDKSIRPILNVFDEIREILRFEKIELPKIVVVGDQSAGKSSVLESITGISLPRGENTVTKCPIVIQIRGVDNENEEFAKVRIEGDDEESAKKILLSQLSESIKEKQEQNLKSSKIEIVRTPIYVYVHKLNAPDLTLYDLPGITYKKKEVTEEVKEIIKQFTKESQTLILLILPANADLTTSEAISLIKENKDYKERTIPIITKIDLIYEKNMKNKILNNELDLQFRPIVVRNRTQTELESNEIPEKIREKELEYINNHNELSELPEECKGTEQLILCLISQQKQKLSNSKYKIKQTLIENISNNKEKLELLPSPAETPTEKLDRFKECLNTFSNNYKKIVKGGNINLENILEKKYKSLSSELKDPKDEDNFVTRIRNYFSNFYKNFQNHHRHFFKKEFREKVLKVIKETRGFHLPNIYDPTALHILISQEFESTAKKPSDELVMNIKENIKDLFNILVKDAFESFPQLILAIKTELEELIEKQSKICLDSILNMINAELESDWTLNPYYMDICIKLLNLVGEKRSAIKSNGRDPNPPNNSLIEINDIKILDIDLYSKVNLEAYNDEETAILNLIFYTFTYFMIVYKRFADYVNLFILKDLIKYFDKNIYLILDKKFSPSNNVMSDLISEDPGITIKRKKLVEKQNNLEKALKQINKIC